MTTTKRAPRAAAKREGTPTPAKPARRTPAAKATPTADDICDLLDDEDFHDEMLVLARGHEEAARVLAGMNEAQRERTGHMQEAQRVYLELANDITYPVDASGRVHDLGGLASMNADTEGANSTLMAIFYTMALLGYRKSGPAFIKKRRMTGGVYINANTWVDIRAVDDVHDELQPEHTQHNRDLPPDLRAAAARRDQEEGMRLSAQWKVAPKPIIKSGPRPEGW